MGMTEGVSRRKQALTLSSRIIGCGEHIAVIKQDSSVSLFQNKGETDGLHRRAYLWVA